MLDAGYLENGGWAGGQNGWGQPRKKAQFGYVPLKHHVPHLIFFFFVGHSSVGLDGRVASGVSELHFGPKLGPTVGPAEAVMVMDVVQSVGETHGGHQQGDA